MKFWGNYKKIFKYIDKSKEFKDNEKEYLKTELEKLLNKDELENQEKFNKIIFKDEDLIELIQDAF